MSDMTCPCGYMVMRVENSDEYPTPAWTATTTTLRCTKCGEFVSSPPQEPQFRDAL